MLSPERTQQHGPTVEVAPRPGQALRPVMLGVLGAALAMLLFIRLAHEMMEGETQRFDAGVLAVLAAHRSAWLFMLMRWVTLVSGPNVQSLLVCVAAGVWAMRGRFRPAGLPLLTAGLGGAALIAGQSTCSIDHDRT